MKCSRRTNNTYSVVSAARGLKRIREVSLLELRGDGVCVCVFVSVWFGAFGRASPTDELFLDDSQREDGERGGGRGGEW